MAYEYKPQVVSLEALPEAAAAGVTLAMTDGASLSATQDPGTTTGIWAEPVEP